MTESNYWTNIFSGRIRRRRALAGAGTLAIGAALLAACGGSDGGSSATADKSSLITAPVDTSKQAKRGGVLKSTRNADMLTWDPYLSSTSWPLFGPLAFSRLFGIKAGYMQGSSGEVIGDLAESWEWSPDRTQLTMKLRPNANWQQLAPVNGRPVDAQDITFSWDRFVRTGTSSVDYANSKNPASPILGVTAPDARTVVMKLAYPMVSLPALLAVSGGGNYHIMPREADSGYDPRKTLIGSGPFILSEYIPSASFKFTRHPGYYEKDTPYVDSIDYPILTEYAAGLAQFNSGAIYTFAVRPEDVLDTKKQSPELLVYKTEVAANGIGASFGWKPGDKTPFRDERLRQAYSMSLDRNLFIDVSYNVSAFEKAGIPVETRWNSCLAANFYEGWWLDPQSKEFGPNSKYFQHNPAEAKKLTTAAGFPDGFDIVSSPFQTDKEIDVVEGMVHDATGIRFTKNLLQLSEWQVKIRDFRGQFEGISYRSITGGQTDALENLSAQFSTKSGATFTGLDIDGKGTGTGDPYIEDLLTKSRAEVDTEKRKALGYDLQRYIGQKQYLVRFPGGASGLELVWPVIRNWRVYQGDARAYYTNWLDETLPPVNKKA